MDGNSYKDGKAFLFPDVSVVHLYSRCFTTLTLTAVVCRRVCVFLLPLFCISMEVFSSSLRYPYTGQMSKARGQNQSPIAVQSTYSCLQKPKMVCNAFERIPSAHLRCRHFSWAALGWPPTHHPAWFCWGLSATYTTRCCEQGLISLLLSEVTSEPIKPTAHPYM